MNTIIGLLGAAFIFLLGLSYGVMSMSPPDFAVARGALFGGVAAGTVCFVLWAFHSNETLAIKTIIGILTGIFIFGGLPGALLWIKSKEPPTGNVFITCKNTFLPSTSSGEELFVSVLSPERLLSMTNNNLPLQRIAGDVGSKINWPKSLPSNPPSWLCQIINDTSTPLLNVALFVNIRYGDEEGKDYIFSIPRLDTGPSNQMDLYFLNLSSDGGSAQFRKAAIATPLGKSEQQIPVAMPEGWFNQAIFLLPALPPKPAKGKK
jgi:hypothetical protein